MASDALITFSRVQYTTDYSGGTKNIPDPHKYLLSNGYMQCSNRKLSLQEGVHLIDLREAVDFSATFNRFFDLPQETQTPFGELPTYMEVGAKVYLVRIGQTYGVYTADCTSLFGRVNPTTESLILHLDGLISNSLLEHLQDIVRQKYTPLAANQTEHALHPEAQATQAQRAQVLIQELKASDIYQQGIDIRFNPQKVDCHAVLAWITAPDPNTKRRTIEFGNAMLAWVRGEGGWDRFEWFRSGVYHEQTHARFDPSCLNQINQAVGKIETKIKQIPGGVDFLSGLTKEQRYKLFYYPMEEIYVTSEQIYDVENRLRQVKTRPVIEDLTALRDDLRAKRMAMIQQVQRIYNPTDSQAILKTVQSTVSQGNTDKDLLALIAYENQFERIQNPNDPSVQHVLRNRYRIDVMQELKRSSSSTEPWQTIIPYIELDRLPFRLKPQNLQPVIDQLRQNWRPKPPPPPKKPSPHYMIQKTTA